VALLSDPGGHGVQAGKVEVAHGEIERTPRYEGNRQLGAAAGEGVRKLAHSLARLFTLPPWWTAYRGEQRRRNQIVRELSAYTPRELAELGFSRADFPAILSGTYGR
jgi:hypothetical protein